MGARRRCVGAVLTRSQSQAHIICPKAWVKRDGSASYFWLEDGLTLREMMRAGGWRSKTAGSRQRASGDVRRTASRRWRAAVLPIAALVTLAAGAILHFSGTNAAWVQRVWLVGLILTGTPVVWEAVRGMLAGQFATDLIAMLAIVSAAALGQPFAGLVIVLMQSGGEALERYAEGRASAAVRALEDAAPRRAHRIVNGEILDVAADRIAVGDRLLVRPGELVPCDGMVVDGRSHVDTSRLTGESIPLTAAPGARLMSGAVNQEGPLTVQATAISRESQYARIVELVRSAQESKSPLQRLADRYAVWFTPLTLAICLVAYVTERDPIRVLAVLVVATPCPLILATPVAIIGGINRAARYQIIVRHGAALEQLAGVNVAVFDKTGTLTVGIPSVSRVMAVAGTSDTDADVLCLAAAVEQSSGHLLARSVVEAALERGGQIPPASDVVEVPGRGVTGTVNHRRVAVGSRSFVADGDEASAAAFAIGDGAPAGLTAYVTVDGRAAGVIDFADQLRPGLDRLFVDLRQLGITRTLLISGDQEQYTRQVAQSLGIRDARAELLPADKVRVIRELVDEGRSVLMVGDGTNDAPALSTATVGVALAGHGGGITAEAADVVILTDNIARVADAIRISRRALRVARQSIWAGLGLSGIAMVIAAAGYIPPAVGALLQEGIDVAVILNALRASSGGIE